MCMYKTSWLGVGDRGTSPNQLKNKHRARVVYDLVLRRMCCALQSQRPPTTSPPVRHGKQKQEQEPASCTGVHQVSQRPGTGGRARKKKHKRASACREAKGLGWCWRLAVHI